MVEYIGEQQIGLGSEAKLWLRCTFNNFSEQELKDIKRAYAWGSIQRLVCYIPSEIFGYTKIFSAALACSIARLFGSVEGMRKWNFHADESSISQAMHTLSRSYYGVGAANPRAGLMFNSLVRQGHRALSAMNFRQTTGCKDVEEDGAFAVNMHAFKCAMVAKVMRIWNAVQLAFAGIMLWIAEVGEDRVASKERWMAVTKEASEVAQNHLEIPSYEIGMFAPNIGQKVLVNAAKVLQKVIYGGSNIYFTLASVKSSLFG